MFEKKSLKMNSNGCSTIPLTRLTARRLQKLSSTTVSAELKEKVALAILDYLGAIAAGLQSPWATQVIKYARSQKGAAQSHAFGLGEPVPATAAAFVNALLAHSIVISAALALAQRDNWTGEQLVKGIIGGYDAASILGVAVQQSPGYNRHMRPSGILGAFGAAAAAVAATNADEKTVVNALAFGANMAGGFNEWAWAGGVEIYTEMGSASQAGIVAFDIAKAGLECSETVLEGRAGLFAAFSASNGAKLFHEGLEKPIGAGIMDVNFKPVPGCNYAQTPLAVALKFAKSHDLSSGVASIHVGCTSGAKNYPGCDNPGPFTTVQQTKMSIHFGVCAVLLHGNVSEELFTKYDSAEITKLASECVVESLQEYEDSFKAGRQPASIQVKLTDGSTLSEALDDVPWLDPQAVRDRFFAETGSILGPEQSRKKMMALVEGLSDLADCGQMFKLFHGADFSQG